MSNEFLVYGYFLETINTLGHFMDIIWIHFGFGHFLDTFWSLLWSNFAKICSKCVHPYILHQHLFYVISKAVEAIASDG